MTSLSYFFMRVLLPISLLLAFSITGGGAEAPSLKMEIDAKTVKAIALAVAEFEKSDGLKDCYKVEVENSGDVVNVHFIPIYPQRQDNLIFLGGRNPCGRGVTYSVVDRKVVRSVYAR